jgi:hypothetical protein
MTDVETVEPEAAEPETPKSRPAKKAAAKPKNSREGRHGSRGYVGKPYERKSVGA